MNQVSLPLLKRLALVLLALVTVLVITLIVLDIHTSAIPILVLPIANTIFICLITIIAAVLAARSFLVSGAWLVILFGAGLWAYGVANLVAGWMPTSHQNVAVTVHNSSSLLAAFVFLLLAIVTPREIPAMRMASRRWLVAAIYGVIIVFVGLLTTLALQDKTAFFFIPGTGPTLLRQIVLGSATVLFFVSALYFLSVYRRSKADFLYWCSLGLGLIAIGFIAISFANVFGDTINWVGRLAQYLGCIYLGVAILVVIRETRRRELPVADVIEDFLRNAEANYQLLVDTTPDAIILIDKQDRVLMWNSAAETMFGYSRTEAVGSIHLNKIIPDTGFVNLQNKIESTFSKIDKPAGNIIELQALRRNGELFPVEISFNSGRQTGNLATTLTLIIRDITERKKAEEEIQNSETRYRTTLESITDAFVSVDRQWRYTYANETATKILYKSREELLGNIVWEVFPDSPEVFNINLRQAMNTNTRVSFEVFYPAVNTWYECHCYPSSEGLNIFFANITDRKLAEEALRNSKAKLETALASMTDAVFISDVNGTFIDFNEAFATYHRFKNKNEVYKTLAEYPNYINVYFADGTLAPLDMWAVPRALRGETETNAEYILERRDTGEKWWGSYSFGPIRNKDGEIVGSVVVGREITERKKTEEMLAAAHRQTQSIINNTPAIVYALDLEERFVMANTALAELLHSTPEQMIGKRRHEFMPKKDADWHEANDQQVIEKGRALEFEEYSQLPGRSITWLTTKFPLRDAQGRIYAMAGISSDITERKRAEESLKKYTRELEVANKELEAFSYSVSHDLRQPLRALDSFSEITLLDYADKLDETGKNNLNRIRKASQTMSILIDDILRLSRITRLEMHLEKVNLSELVKSIADELKNTHPERHVEFTIEPEIVINGDKNLLQIGVMNLLDNAWKFTGKCEAAKIEFGQTQKNGEYIFFIRDNGIGFDMRYKDKLFQPFQRLHTQKDYSGTGIGLATVQRVVRRHNGRIWAESEPGKGTTFCFTLGNMRIDE